VGQAAKRARDILVQLEDAKLSGRDYDIGLLVALRQVPRSGQLLCLLLKLRLHQIHYG